MGANGSYDKKLGGVPKDKRTHTETGYTVMGHRNREPNKEHYEFKYR